MGILVLLLRIFLFFTLFSFALNNRQDAAVKWFFGFEWRAPMVFIVLAAFTLGCALGCAAMLPSWWRQRRIVRRLQPAPPAPEPVPVAAASPLAVEPIVDHPPRDGL